MVKSSSINKKGTAITWIIFTLFLAFLLIIGGGFAIYFFKERKKITIKDIKAAEEIIGLDFTQKERKMMLDNLRRNRSNYKELRKISLQNHVTPSLLFNPLLPGMCLEKEQKPFHFSEKLDVTIPDNFEDLAFYPFTALAQLIKTQKITSAQITQLYLSRLKKYGPRLKCVITLTEEKALEQAKHADEEIAAGLFQGTITWHSLGGKRLACDKGNQDNLGCRTL